MFDPTLNLLVTLLRGHTAKARRSEAGASAVEWVVIAAIVVGICLAVALILRSALEDKATDVSTEIRGS